LIRYSDYWHEIGIINLYTGSSGDGPDDLPGMRFMIPILPVLLLAVDIRPAFAATDLTDGPHRVAFPAEELNEIPQLLPENGGRNTASISNNADPNIHLIAEADIELTFIDKGSGYKTSFGYSVNYNYGNTLSQWDSKR
jgi:hypothetical protein